MHTLKIDSFILVFDFEGVITTYKSDDIHTIPSDVIAKASLILSPGTYPLPAKDRLNLISINHPQFDLVEFNNKVVYN